MKKREINEAPRPKVPKPKQFRARTRGESVSEQKTLAQIIEERKKLVKTGYPDSMTDFDYIVCFREWIQQKQQQYESRNYNELLEDLKE